MTAKQMNAALDLAFSNYWQFLDGHCSLESAEDNVGDTADELGWGQRQRDCAVALVSRLHRAAGLAVDAEAKKARMIEEDEA